MISDYEQAAQDHALSQRRLGALEAARRWFPCHVCGGSGRNPSKEFDFLNLFAEQNDCVECWGTGTMWPAVFADAYPVRFGGHTGWLTLLHTEFTDQPVVVDAMTEEVYQSAQFSELLVLNAEGLADLTDFQSADDILHRARRDGFRVRFADRLWGDR